MDHSLLGGSATIPVESLVTVDISSLEFRHGCCQRSRFTRRLRYYPSRIARDRRHLAPRITLWFLDCSLHGGYATIPVESLVTVGITPLKLRYHPSVTRSRYTRRLRHYPSGIACNRRHLAPRITLAHYTSPNGHSN